MRFNKIDNISSLNIIRAITALIVVIYHAKFILWCGGNAYIEQIGFQNWIDYPLFALDMLSSNGEPIVICFFILSGFVITHSFRKSSYSSIQFYIIRIVRIYIPFLNSIILAVIILFFTHYINPEIFEGQIREYNERLGTAWNELHFFSLIKSLILIKEKEYIGLNFVYWSLVHEIIFYLVYPIYNMIKLKGRTALFIALILFFIITKNHLIYNQLYFLIGIFIYDYFAIKKTSSALFKSKKINLLVICFLYILMTVSFIKGWKITADFFSAIMSLVAFDFVLTFISKPNNLIIKLSEYSYTLYLNHLPVLLLTYALISTFVNQAIFYERYYYYIGVLIAVIVCKYLFYAEHFSLYLIKKLKLKFSKN